MTVLELRTRRLLAQDLLCGQTVEGPGQCPDTLHLDDEGRYWLSQVNCPNGEELVDADRVYQILTSWAQEACAQYLGEAGEEDPPLREALM